MKRSLSKNAGSLRARVGRYRFFIYPRSIAVCLFLSVFILSFSAMLLHNGVYRISTAEIVRVISHPDQSAISKAIWNMRLPVIVTAIGTGACLGIAGQLFQSLSQNALGSPELLGMSSGAALGAAVGVIVFNTSAWGTALAAVMGCLVATIIGYLLGGGGARQVERILLVGIGLSAFWSSLTSVLMTRADAHISIRAQVWLVGTLNARTWQQALVAYAALLALSPFAFLCSRYLTDLELGTDMAQQHGVSIDRITLTVAILGVGLTAAAVAATGPIAFVALAAPHFARSLAGNRIVPIACSAFAGASLVVFSQWAIQHLPKGMQAPVGLVTSVLGGIYLIIVIMRRRT